MCRVTLTAAGAKSRSSGTWTICGRLADSEAPSVQHMLCKCGIGWSSAQLASLQLQKHLKTDCGSVRPVPLYVNLSLRNAIRRAAL